MTSNDHIINAFRADSVESALKFYGMGGVPGPVETADVAAVIERLTDTTIVCDVINPKREAAEPFRRCEFLRASVAVNLYSSVSAIVTVPRAWLPVFCLWDFVLDGKTLERYAERAAEYNAPYLPPPSSRKPEKIGSVRI